MLSHRDAPISTDYTAARDRFRRAAIQAGAASDSWTLGPVEDDLTIDTARLGPEDAEGLVFLSSGLHGVEGPLGSAIQSRWLEGNGPRQLPSGVAILMIHALNPFGFATGRRFDAENIDLNRNFLQPGEPYQGSPPLYGTLDPLLNPAAPPGPWDALTFQPRALWTRSRYGMPAVKQAIAGGQYDYPRGLFFGGHGASLTSRILENHLPALIEPARRVIHLDVHTGLGPWNTETLLIHAPRSSPTCRRFVETFGTDRLSPMDADGVAYQTRGSLGDWCAHRFGVGRCTYDYACAEFGTYPAITVLSALRAENQAFHFADHNSPARRQAVARLREAFIPADPSWQRRALEAGRDLMERAIVHVDPRRSP
ncbi:M14 family metallopeptidase [Tautonia rosea]|uniref:M14 family metallopeptidase n=1 Tax=Tautonia rosea TaxID=2728037 RepID=UPI0014728148|nr:M14 family metallopeptidase [Tautonia rosea]